MKLTSPAFQNDQTIPAKYTCEGTGVSPPLAWQGVPARAKSLVLIEDDGTQRTVPADEVIDTMGEIGREMDVRYRETAGGGLAATPTGRRLARERLIQIKKA